MLLLIWEKRHFPREIRRIEVTLTLTGKVRVNIQKCYQQITFKEHKIDFRLEYTRSNSFCFFFL